MLFHRIMSIVMTFVMVLSSLFSTGFLTGITVYAADGDRDLTNVVKNQNLGWNLSNDSGVQAGNADQPIYPYEDIYELINTQLKQGIVTIDFTGLNRIDNDHGSGNEQKIWDRQQIKTFRLKYVFLAAKIIKTARSVIMKLSSKYPYQEVYKKCICLES